METPTVKVTLTFTYQLDPNSEHYPSGSTVDDMAAIDEKRFNDDPAMVMFVGEYSPDFKLTIDPVSES